MMKRGNPPIAYCIALGRCGPLRERYSFGCEAGPEARRHCHWVTAIRSDHDDKDGTVHGVCVHPSSDLAVCMGFAVGSGLGLEPEDGEIDVNILLNREFNDTRKSSWK